VAAIFNQRAEDLQSSTTVLGEYLRERELLLILDNCEHLADACADLTSALLRACPELRVLTTSREPLGTAGEVCWPVQPLSLPTTLALVPTAPGAERPLDSVAVGEQECIDAVLASGAGCLFVERARAVRPSLALTAEAATSIAQICHQLDGIPLA